MLKTWEIVLNYATTEMQCQNCNDAFGWATLAKRFQVDRLRLGFDDIICHTLNILQDE